MEPKERTILELLSQDEYIVPLYQRNYAWRETEIKQLLQDVLDKHLDNPDSNYYIGTLIVDKRKDGKFEIIDGQQRHTTLTLINAVFKIKAKEYSVPKSNLGFDARTDIKHFLEELYSNYEKAKKLEINPSFQIALKTIEEFLREHEKEKKWISYFYNKVKIIRIRVPEDTDINHYFEVMNNRGEQLEKHEILKAKFISEINKKSLRKEFAVIWDACSQMDRHIQTCFVPDKMRNIFGDDYTQIPKNYLKDDNGQTEVINSNGANHPNLADILGSNELPTNSGINIENKEGKYKSIIDFPNFLLQVLKLIIPEVSVSLDDKKVLDEFGYTNKIVSRRFPDPLVFINSLLYYRTLFDKYIIKREEGSDDWKWILLQPSKGRDDSLVYKNTFGEDDSEDPAENKQFIMVQSMLHVSFPNASYKNWLHDALKELKDNITNIAILSILEKTAQKQFEEIGKDVFHQGTHTPRYLFNYLDYFLWKEYEKFVKGEKVIADSNFLHKRISNCKERFGKFRFTQNNSVEHLHPQKDIGSLVDNQEEDDDDFKDKSQILNHFGNLCLISQGSNSKYSDYNFLAKKQQFEERKSIESLKQVIMFSYKVDDWNREQIKNHGKEMIELLENKNT